VLAQGLVRSDVVELVQCLVDQIRVAAVDDRSEQPRALSPRRITQVVQQSDVGPEQGLLGGTDLGYRGGKQDLHGLELHLRELPLGPQPRT